jgi:chromosomal replication initiation ATPase DnaA
MNELEYRNFLAEKLMKGFIKEFKEKTGLKITSINISGNILLNAINNDSLEKTSIISLEALENIVLETVPYNITPNLLRSRHRRREYVDTRSMFAHIARRFNFKFKSIGDYINRDHSSIMHLDRKASDLIETDPVFMGIYTNITNKIKETYAKVV